MTGIQPGAGKVDEMDEMDEVDSSYGESFGYKPVESQLRDKSANSGTQNPLGPSSFSTAQVHK